MKGKLSWDVDFYGLKVDDKILGLTDERLNKMLNYPHQLCLSNCYAIDKGYDLDDLAKKELEKEQFLTQKFLENIFKNSFIKGFDKALEILGEKGFTEYDVHHSFFLGERNDRDGFLEYLQSLKQNEWDVEVEMHEVWKYGDFEYKEPFIEPKLDSKGCLILKRI
jgi:hypothetical protein